MSKGIKIMGMTTIILTILICCGFLIGTIVFILHDETIPSVVFWTCFIVSLHSGISLISDYLEAKRLSEKN